MFDTEVGLALPISPAMAVDTISSLAAGLQAVITNTQHAAHKEVGRRDERINALEAEKRRLEGECDELRKKLRELNAIRDADVKCFNEGMTAANEELDELRADARRTEAAKPMTEARAEDVLQSRRHYNLLPNGSVWDVRRATFVCGPDSPNLSVAIHDRPAQAIEELEAIITLCRACRSRKANGT